MATPIPTPEQLRARQEEFDRQAAEKAKIALARAAESTRDRLQNALTHQGCTIRVITDSPAIDIEEIIDTIRPEFEEAGWTLTYSRNGSSQFAHAEPTR